VADRDAVEVDARRRVQLYTTGLDPRSEPDRVETSIRSDAALAAALDRAGDLPWPWCPKDPMSSRSSPDEALLLRRTRSRSTSISSGHQRRMFVAAMVDALPALAGR
jgi:hypothetical protein